jgi:hypothetical protein
MTDHPTSSNETLTHRQDLLKAVVVAVFSLLLYSITRTRHFGGDDTVYALVVQRWLEVGSIERVFFHPHHVLYNPLVGMWAWVVHALTGSVFVLDVGAAVSAVAAAFTVAGVYLVLRRFRVDDRIALLTTATLAVSGGLWRYATRMEVYTLAAAGVVVWLAAMSDERASWPKLAAGFAAPWLGHSVLGLLVAPGAWLQRHRPRELVVALAAGLVAPGVLILGLLAWLLDARSGGSLVTTVLGSGSSRWLSLPDPLAALRAVGGLVVTRIYATLPVYPPWAGVVFDVLAVLSILALTAFFAWGAYTAVRNKHRLGVSAILGVVCLIPLWLVWDVGNPEHAVAASPLFAVLVALGASAVRPRAGRIGLAVAAASMLTVNGLGSALLQTQANLSRTLLVVDHVRETIPEQASLVSVGVDAELRLALPHLGGRRVVDLTAIVHSARRAGASPEDALERWIQSVAAADSAWMLEDPDSLSVRHWVEELGIPHQVWREALAQCRFGRASTLEADGVVMKQSINLRPVEVATPQEDDR